MLMLYFILDIRSIRMLLFLLKKSKEKRFSIKRRKTSHSFLAAKSRSQFSFQNGGFSFGQPTFLGGGRKRRGALSS